MQIQFEKTKGQDTVRKLVITAPIAHGYIYASNAEKMQIINDTLRDIKCKAMEALLEHTEIKATSSFMYSVINVVVSTIGGTTEITANVEVTFDAGYTFTI